jgi:type III restriction enzyme
VVLNDEAHHIHDNRLAWFKSIEDIHHRLKQKGSNLSLQLDVTATPKHNNGAIFVQTVADYPLVEAIYQNVVKHPVLPDAASRAKLKERQSAKFTEKYADYLDLGVIEWRKVYAEHQNSLEVQCRHRQYRANSLNLAPIRYPSAFDYHRFPGSPR